MSKSARVNPTVYSLVNVKLSNPSYRPQDVFGNQGSKRKDAAFYWFFIYFKKNNIFLDFDLYNLVEYEINIYAISNSNWGGKSGGG